MDIASLTNFQKEIEQIRKYMTYLSYSDEVALKLNLEIEDTVLKELIINLKDHLITFARDKKIFEYKAAIISLYGVLEKHVEIWLKEFLEAISKIVNDYTLISEKIRNYHFDFSIKLINSISNRDSAKFQYLRKETVLSKLNQCLTNPTNYQFNSDAFVILSGNLKHNKIVELFKSIDLNINESLKSNQTFISYYKKEQGIDHSTNISGYPSEDLFFKVNDLVDRRNLIAHGSEKIDDLLDRNILITYINFLEKYCEAIFEILSEEYVKYESIFTFTKIETVHNVWQNSILGCSLDNHDLKVGDSIIVQTAEDKFKKLTVLEIEVEGKQHEILSIRKNLNVGIKVCQQINKKCQFYLKRLNQ